MARKSESHKTFNIAVVGLSGTEKDKGCMGSGKSCLCNRFVRPSADDYHIDHISVLSQSDFSGRIVNNDHWLYWGETSKTTDEGVELHFSIIEQTEFIDDACFQSFKVGKTEPYYKRCATTRVCSAEKLMYICKNQLGIEIEYEQKYLNDGRFNVDGFVCVYDVSEIQGRTLEKNVEHTALILSSLLKTKKPIVLATTKQDEGNDIYLREAERLINRKDFRGYIPMIETSAHENINTDLPFIVCAQMIDRTKGKAKILLYQEAMRYRKEILDFAHETFMALIRMHVTDYRSAWHTCLKKLSTTPEYATFCDLFGQDAAHQAFKRHTKRLKEDFISRKLHMYMRILPEVLTVLVPDLDSLGNDDNCDWETVKIVLKDHPDFDQYFVENPPHIAWHEVDLHETNDTRIPLDLLDVPEAERCFIDHRRALEGEDKRKDLRQQFKQLLQETGYITPAKLFNEVRVLFMGRECYESLSEQDLNEIYEEHQKDLTDRAKASFQELLQEHSELFYHFASLGPGSIITQDDIFKITEVIAEDIRYKALDRLEQDRTLMLLRHLGFIHGPIREHCPAFPICADTVIEKAVSTKVRRKDSCVNEWYSDLSSNDMSIVILGADGLGLELAAAFRKVNETFEVDQVSYALDFRIIEGDVDLPQNAFTTNDFTPQGCFCVYSNHQTLEYINESLEKTLLSNLEQEDRLPFHGLPIVLLFSADVHNFDQDVAFLREEGEKHAKSLQCPFIDLTPDHDRHGLNGLNGSDSQSLGSILSNEQQERWFSEEYLTTGLRALIECVQRKSATFVQTNHNHIPSTLPEKSLNPDIRLLMCFLCGDPFNIDQVIGHFVSHQNCYITSANSIVIEAAVEENKRIVEIIFTSYHGAQAYRDELLHGFVLVYSSKRKASLSTLSAFSNNIPNTPTQILAVTDLSQANAVFYSNDLSHLLVSEGSLIAEKIHAHFITISSQQKATAFTPFLKEVWERKPQIEKAFDMDGSEYSLERHTPLPLNVPSRQGSRAGDDSEGLYEQLASSENPSSPYMERERNTPQSPSDDSDIYATVAQNENGEQLVKPSQMKNRRSLQAEHYRQSLRNSDSAAGGLPHSRHIPISVPDVALPAQLSQKHGLAFPPPYSRTASPPPSYISQYSPKYSGHRPPLGMLVQRSHERGDMTSVTKSSAYATGRRSSAVAEDVCSSHYSYQMRKSNSLRSQPTNVPNLAVLRNTRFAEDIEASDNMSDEEEDTVSSGLSGHGAYPPPEPAPPDYPHNLLASGGLTASSIDEGWVDNRYFDKNLRHGSEEWLDNDVYQAYQSEHQMPQSAKHKPGKLNLKQFGNITDAVGRLNITQRPVVSKSHAPLAAPEAVEFSPDYARDGYFDDKNIHYNLHAISDGKNQRLKPTARRKDNSTEKASASESDSSSPERKQAQLSGRPNRKGGPKKSRKKRGIPVAPPRLPSFEGATSAQFRSSQFSNVPNIAPIFQHKVLNAAASVADAARADNGDSLSPSDLSNGEGFQAEEENSFLKRSFLRKRPKPFSHSVAETCTESLQSPTNNSFFFDPPERSFSIEPSQLSYSSSSSKLKIDNASLGLTGEDNVFDSNKETTLKQLGLLLKSKSGNIGTESEKAKERKEKKKIREDEKLEKRRVKEIERQRRLVEKEKKKQKKNGGVMSGPSLEDFVQSEHKLTPLFVEKCIEFIEEEGLDSERIYRVPGNRSHVDLLFQKFDEDQNISIHELDIPVNAVATALKDFFSKRLPALIPPAIMDELTEIANIRDKGNRLMALRGLLLKLPPVNHSILKYVFEHFVRVSENSKLNSMDSKNLAICWWPTLLPFEFNDMLMFERMRPHLEESVQMMIDQFKLLFCDESEDLIV